MKKYVSLTEFWVDGYEGSYSDYCVGNNVRSFDCFLIERNNLLIIALEITHNNYISERTDGHHINHFKNIKLGELIKIDSVVYRICFDYSSYDHFLNQTEVNETTGSLALQPI
jgi:hypothetical protein